MDHLKIIRDISLKNIHPLYVLAGDEPYFIDQITDYMEDHVLTETERAFGQHILYGRDSSLDQVLSIAKSYPMAGERQLVIVKEAQDLKEWKKADELKGLEAYAASPTPSTVLVFAFKGKGLDKRTKAGKALEKAGVVFTSERVREYKLPDWISSYVRDRGFVIREGSSNLLAEYLGADLGKVVNAVNKLAVVLPAGSTIEPAHIEEYIGISKEYNVWELQKALGEKNVLKANKIIDYFRANPKSNPIQMVLPVLHNYFFRLAIYQSMSNKNEAARELQINPMALNEIRVAEKNYSPKKLERIIHSLREADRRSKGLDNAETSNEDLMKELVFKILH